MNKNYIYILLVIILLLVSHFIKKSDTKALEIDGIKYAISVDGKKQNNFPTKNSYTVDINCSGADGSWDYQKWAVKISDITGNVSCNISFKSVPKETFNNYIKNLLGTNIIISSESTPGNGSTLEKITNNGEEDYRYRGINPANYIMFNNELWRIIGVFDHNTHGIPGTRLVKIIRNNVIGQYVWDNASSTGRNNFPNSDIYNTLNAAYYNHIDATGEDYCHRSMTTAAYIGKCDFTKIGIQDDYRSMVENNVNWFLGGISDNAITSSTAYQRERSTNKYSSNNATTKAAGLTVPVGLMYVSDYGYAAPSTCTSNLSDYNTDGCGNKNWLKFNEYEWTITHNSASSSEVFYVGATSALNKNHAYIGLETRPTLYLKSNVYYLSGTGTQIDPYIIAYD